MAAALQLGLENLWLGGPDEAEADRAMLGLDDMMQAVELDPDITVSLPADQRAVFSIRWKRNRRTKIKDITDGTSKTILMTEYLTAPATDLSWRGWFFVLRPASMILQATYTPNTSVPDGLDPVDTGGCTESNGANLPRQNLPCEGADGAGVKYQASARSYHPGGVHAVLADGSVQFISETIDLTTWRTLSWIADGKTVKLD
jgi:prepilin-type processing-associated H-X9-DG protein